ncbi:MAG: dihydroorotase [Arenicellales bacterium]|nr:dihydroorotase [Arenicellales bacterium]
MADTLITNARLINEGAISEVDVLIRGDRIERVDKTISAGANVDVYDAEGNCLLPGLIDDQVHFREPGGTQKGDIATESAAALAGGITSFMEMPNVNPPTVSRDLLQQKYMLAEQKSRTNYAFYLGATNDNIDQVQSLLPGEACGVKVFMGASTGNMLVDKPATLEAIFSSSPVPVVTHCEDTPTILANEQHAREQYGENVPIQYHPLIRSAEACYISSSLAVELAHRHHTRLHVLHLTTARELELFSNLALDQKHITVEVCVHHLFFDDSDYASKKGLIKCNPAIKTSDDRQALLRGVTDNLVDVIATDHAPHTWEEKQQPYFQMPSGLPLVQHALLSVLEHYHRGILSLELIVQKMAHAPAIIFGVVDRGFVREGYWADLVLVDLNRPYTVAKENVLYKCRWSPFEGYSFRSSIMATWINGELAYHKNRVLDNVRGKRLEIDNHQPR